MKNESVAQERLDFFWSQAIRGADFFISAIGPALSVFGSYKQVIKLTGENVQAVPVAKWMRIKDLGDPNPDGTPANVIDVLHRMCVFREKADTAGIAEFLDRSGQGRNPNLWLLARAISEILPDGDKEKQLMQGLLNQKEQLEEAGRQRKLF